MIALMLSLLIAANDGTSEESAHALVTQSIAIVGVHRDLHTLHSLRASTRDVTFDIRQGDHVGAPYYTSVSVATVTDDFHNDAMLRESTSTASATTTLYNATGERL